MIEDTTDNLSGNFNFDLPKNKSNVIKVVGIGGGGGNAINYMFQQGIVGVDFVICNTDAQALEKSAVPIKIQLGASLTEGLGAGANPDIGRQAAQESFEDLKTLLSTQTKMIFITAGMGGGTGTGAAPIIARMAREMDILTVGIVTMPFQFEGKIRLAQAQHGLEQLKANVDSLIVINNNKLREVYGNLGFKAGFAKADEVLATAARGIAEVITHHYTQNIDLKDAKTVLSNSGSAIMGSAEAQGANRAQESIVKALDSPLLNDNKIEGCKNVLLLIVSGEEEITIDEIGEINDYIQTEAGNNTNIIMGVGEDLALGNSISVTIIATGFNSEQQHEIVNTEAKKIIHTLEDEQSLVHDLSEEKVDNTIFEPPLEKASETPIVRYDLEEDAVDSDTTKTKAANENVDPLLVNEIELNYTHVLPETPEENPLVETTDLIAEIPVVAEAVGNDETQNESKEITAEDSAAEDEFVFNEINTSLNSIDVIDPLTIEAEEQQQIQFEFEMPLSQEQASGDLAASISMEEPSTEEPTVFMLDDAQEITGLNDEKVVEESITLKKIADVPQEVMDEVSPSQESESNPFDQSIRESIKQQNEKRKEQLKQFNYTFKNNLNRIEEMERQPAYKRLGFELEAPPEGESPSTLSLDNDSNDDVQLRSNNSFLHDNVD